MTNSARCGSGSDPGSQGRDRSSVYRAAPRPRYAHLIGIDWVITENESGQKARPSDPGAAAFARSPAEAGVVLAPEQNDGKNRK
jgi:hypothetical protein